jgi:two-component system alkaline phosphatase synthesis response regulator PhoP
MGRILVAEDEQSLAELIQVNLEDSGHEVTIAEDGRFALKALMEEGPFDLVVLDLMMPWADGFDVLRNLGERRPKVLVLTAREDEYTEDRATQMGVDAYMTKPYDPDALLTKISELL